MYTYVHDEARTCRSSIKTKEIVAEVDQTLRSDHPLPTSERAEEFPDVGSITI